MANELNGRIWTIDTAGAGMVTSDAMYVKSIRLVADAGAAGNRAIVQDTNSKVLWGTVVTGADYTEEAVIENWWMTGFKVPTLEGTAPKLYITLG